MTYNIVFNDGNKLPTFDFKTAFKACEMPDRVAAVTCVNPQTNEEEVLWGELPYENEAVSQNENETDSCNWLIKVNLIGSDGRCIERFRLDDKTYDNTYSDIMRQFMNRNQTWDYEGRKIMRAYFYHKENEQWVPVKFLNFNSHEEICF